MIIQFICGFLSCVGFAFFFNAPKRSILLSAIAGGLGWVCYEELVQVFAWDEVIATLAATVLLGTLCEIFCRIQKDAVTIYIIPAILPLVPGAGLYQTLTAYLAGQWSLVLSYGLTTLGCAISIAIGILIVSTVSTYLWHS